jgi:putative CocE/NonD family hydrolase
MLALADPPDDRTVEARPDVQVFTSEPLRTPIDLAGPVVAVLEVGSSAPSMHLVVRLLDVFPDGHTRRVCDGAALIRGASQESMATVSLGHVGYRVRTDHSLRVHVASSDFPRLLPYPGTEDDPWTAERVAVNEQRLRIGGHGGSRLEVSVLAAPTALRT